MDKIFTKSKIALLIFIAIITIVSLMQDGGGAAGLVI